MSKRKRRQQQARRSFWRRLASAILWYLVPLVVALVAVAYIYGAMILHVNPPVVPVQGISMQPTLKTGDLVILSAADPSTLKKGDVIAVHISQQDQSTYGVPANVVHRIVKISQGTEGLVFTTKGDNNSGPDVFHTQAAAVAGRVKYTIPYAGFPILFVQSKQGKIFLGAAVLVGLLYFVFGMIDERRAHLKGTIITMQAVLNEVEKLEKGIANSNYSAATASRDGGSGPLARADVLALAEPPYGAAFSKQIVDDVSTKFLEVVTETSRRSIEMENIVSDLVGAVGEYGLHLRSHTAILQNLAAATAELHRATASFGKPVSELKREGDEQRALSAPVTEGSTFATAPIETVDADSFSFLSPELRARRASLMSTTARVDHLLDEFTERLSGSNDG